jgi:hypothetical protein
MTKCLACLQHAKSFIKLDESRKKRYVEYSTTFYDGLFHVSKDYLEPELMKCTSCNHVFYRKMPSDRLLSDMYSFKRPRKNDPSRAPSSQMIRTMKKCFKMVGKLDPVMLDYGAGHGRWSVAAVKAGFQVVAYDPHAARTVKNPDYELFIDRKDMPQMEYDFIWCEQVLEHVKDPYAVLQDIKKFASTQTIVKVSVPNVDRAKEGKDIWELWPYNGTAGDHTMAPYQHLQGFGQLSLSRLSYRAGFRGLNGLRFIINFPLHKIRFLAGKVFRRFSTTTMYLVLTKS